MRLHIPKNVSLVMDAREDEYVMDMNDWLILQEVMECCKDFNDLKRKAGKAMAQTNVELRYPGMLMKTVPNGSMGDWYISLLNCWGDYVEEVLEGKTFPAAIETDIIIARMAEDMNVSIPTARKRLDSLRMGKYIKMEYGAVLFPKENLVRGG
jgi:hypothetical protein